MYENHTGEDLVFCHDRPTGLRAIIAVDDILGIDMGTSMADLATIGVVAPRVACHDSDPSPWTALGVYAGIRAAVAHVDGRRDVSDLRVAIQGAGHVGATLARLLSRGGAQVVIADIHPARARAVAAKHGCQVVSPDEIIRTPCHVLAPCAVAQVFDTTNADCLRCSIIAGGANDQLATLDRGIRAVLRRALNRCRDR